MRPRVETPEPGAKLGTCTNCAELRWVLEREGAGCWAAALEHGHKHGMHAEAAAEGCASCAVLEAKIAAAFPAFVRAVSHLRACWDALREVENAVVQDFADMTTALGDGYGGDDNPPELEDFRTWVLGLTTDGDPHAPDEGPTCANCGDPIDRPSEPDARLCVACERAERSRG